MNETVNLHLPQWEETDRIHHDDFNDAFAAIDTAVAAASTNCRYELFRTITTTEEKAQIDIDLTDVDWSIYRHLLLIFDGKSTHNTGAYLRVNNDSTSGHYRKQDFESNNIADWSNFGGLYVSTDIETCFSEAIVTGGVSYPKCEVRTYGGISAAQHIYTGGSLQTLNLIPGSGPFKSGFRITIYGMRF